MTLKDIYSIPKFKKLDRVGKIIFVFSFLFPALILYTFLHLYFLPFGLNKNYDLESKEVKYLNSDFLYNIDGEELLDGIVDVSIEPRIVKRNPFVTATVEGEGSYIVQHRIPNKDILFNPEYTKVFDEEFEYKLLNDYKVKDSDMLVFKIEYELDFENRQGSEVVFKYKNLKVLQHEKAIELRLDKRIENELKSYQTRLQLYSEDFDSPTTLYAIYKKPNEKNGFLEIVAKNRISDRTIIPSPEKEYDEKIETIETETVWHPELVKDFSQKFISLKQEQYTYDFLQRIPLEFRDILNPYAYYEKLYKPENFEEEELVFHLNGEYKEEEIVAQEEAIEVEETQEVGIEDDEYYEDVTLIGEGFFRYEEKNPNKRYQVFHKRDFLNSFTGSVKSIGVGYEYPITLKKDLRILFPRTPLTIRVIGENSEIKNLKINLQREPIWEKF